MASSLLKNYNSEYVRQSNRLTGHPQVVEVWVEDEYDVPFWNDLLNEYQGIEFRITPYKNRNLNKGKGNILKYSDLLGPNLIACVDSDYDYLLPDISDSGYKLKNNPFILQTYSYAVENLNCHPSTLGKICINATLETSNFNFVDFFKNFSKAIYPLLLWSLILRKNKMNSILSFNDFKNIINIEMNVNEENKETVIAQTYRKVRKAVNKLDNEYPEISSTMTDFEQKISERGVKPDNCFLFINGHILQDIITQRLLVPICKEIINKHIQKIFRSKGTINEKERKKAHYDNITRRSLTVLLASNFEYKEYSGIYSRMIRPRIDELVELIRKDKESAIKEKTEQLYA